MAEPTYIAPTIETDPDQLAQESFDSLELLQPGWAPAEGNLDTLVLEETAGIAAIMRDLAAQVPTTIFRYMGASLFGIVPIDASPAYVTSTWIATDNAGYTIPAGTQVTIARTGSDRWGFEVVTDVDIVPGSSQTASGAVELQALIAGSDSNGLTDDPELVDPLPWVQSIVLQDDTGAAVPTANGVDAELDNDYLDRLVQELELLSPTPITARDFAVLYKTLPGVERALALDGYDPVADTFGNERMVTLVAVDAAGEAITPTIKGDAVAMFGVDGQYETEVNFIVNTADPTYSVIDVDVTVTYDTRNYTAASIIANVEAALDDYFSPANWGVSFTHEAFGSSEVTNDWVKEDHVYYLELTTLVNNVDGVDLVTSLTFNISGSTLGTADIALPGAAPLTQPGTITVGVA